MPVINIRKRKPNDASALDKLVSVSAQELSSRGPRVHDGDDASSGSDSASSNSGDIPLRRMRQTSRRRRAAPPTSHAVEDASGSDEASSLFSPLVSQHKRRRVRGSDDSEVDVAEVEEQIDSMRSLLRRAERTFTRKKSRKRNGVQQGSRESEEDWCSTRMQEEIQSLHTTVQGLLGRSLVADKQAPSNPLHMLRTTHNAVRGIQSMLSEPVDADMLALYTRSSLNLLWEQARHAAEYEMRSKLTFWKHKAQDLKEKLRAACEPALTSKPTPPAALRDALDFVSTFYLLEMTPDPARGLQPDPAKQLSITNANERISKQLQVLETQRLREMPVEQPLARSLLMLSQLSTPRAVDSDVTSFGTVAGAGARAKESSCSLTDDEVLSIQSPRVQVTSFGSRPPQQNVLFSAGASATATVAPVSTSRMHPPTSAPVAAARPTSHSTEALSNVASKGLNLAARRRLSLLLESQLQSKSPSSQQVPVSLPTSANSVPHSSSNLSAKKRPTPLQDKEPLSGGSSSSEAVAPQTSQAAPTERASLSNTAPPTPQLSPPSTMNRAELEDKDGSATVDPTADSNSDSESGSGSGCTTCGRNDSYSSLLLCDNGCEREFHTFCLQPSLDKIPEGDWYCPKCLAMENIKSADRVYLCSAALCEKITGAKYCSIHRCKFGGCSNRDNAGGFCRRHEKHREPKAPRRGSASSDAASSKSTGKGSSTTAKAATVSTPATKTPALASTPLAKAPSSLVSSSAKDPPVPVPTKAHALALAASSTLAAPATATPAKSEGPPSRLNAEQLMDNMRRMGIWLPPNMAGRVAQQPPAPQKTT